LGEALEWHRLQDGCPNIYYNLNRLSSMNDGRVPQVSPSCETWELDE